MSESRFTLDAVARFNGEKDAKTWIVIKDVVYDVTNFLNEHPGGGELLLEYAGKDATAAFEDFGHSSDAKNMLSSYRIGELVESDKAFNRTRKGKIIKDSKLTSDSPKRSSRRPFLRVLFGGCL